MKERVPYALQFDCITALREEIKELKETVKTQQEAVNASTNIIDELRKENKLLKKGLYPQSLHNEIGKYKQLYNKAVDDYESLYNRHELLLSKYIRQ